MLDHVSIAVMDLPQAARFYDAVMAALGQPCVWREERATGCAMPAAT
jgi:catechol 2,3-dioxygenase-like lactoylglutathione lyase family enzyme